jgi:hypothetical protein
MNKHLKPGVAVDVRGASDEVKEQVMAAFVGAGAIRTTDDRMTNFICWDSSIKRVYFFGGYSIGRHELISINQALGRESEVENTWFERRELPPVDVQCMRGDCVVEIAAHLFNGDSGYAAYQHVDGNGCGYARAESFRPLKTEKEKLVERLVLIMNDNTNATFTEISGVLYDKGLRFTE